MKDDTPSKQRGNFPVKASICRKCGDVKKVNGRGLCKICSKIKK